MAQYRCKMCGSSKIVLERKQEGYNKKKGIWGTMLFGAAGAIAGTDGNTVIYYHCGDCGAVINEAMPVWEKDNIDDCLKMPYAFESSLRNYKKKYKNIEWEEPLVEEPQKRLSEDDIEPIITEYMKKTGKPERLFGEYSKMGIGEDDRLSHTGAIVNLINKGFIKRVKIGGEDYFVLVTDPEEMNTLALERQAPNLAEKLKRDTKKDYTSVLRELLTKKSMKLEEIEDWLKESGLLEENVLSAAKENPFILKNFVKLLLNDGISCENECVSYYICENDSYRAKTEEELKNDLDKSEQEYQKRLKITVDKVWMPIINILKSAKEPISSFEIRDKLNKIGAKDWRGSEWREISVSSHLRSLEEVGLVVRKIEKKRLKYSIRKMSGKETSQKLIEAIEASEYIVNFDDIEKFV